MRLLVAGDTHGNKDHVEYLHECAAMWGVDTIVQVGDFGYWPHTGDFFSRYVSRLAQDDGVTWYWLDGNHENFDALEEIGAYDAGTWFEVDPGVYYLPRGLAWEWDGIRFMSFGGAYSIDKEYRTPHASWWPQELPTFKQIMVALDVGKVDVLLTHDAPEGTCPVVGRGGYKDDEFSRANRRVISSLIESSSPSLLIHGHYHHRYSAWSGPTRVMGLGRDGQGSDSFLILDTDRLQRGLL